MVLSVEKKFYVIEQPISLAPPANSTTRVLVQWNAFYDAHNEAATPQVMAIQGGRIQKSNKKSLDVKGKGKGKGKGKDKSYIPKLKNPKPYAKEHRQRMMPVTTTKRWSIVYDIGHDTYICNTKHGLRGEMKLKQRALYLCVGNGVHAQVEAIRTDDLVLPNGLVFKNESRKSTRKDYKGTSIRSRSGVSERKNRTFLDMVRSMMNLTTFPLSFWDYALEFATHILNMVLTKKVDKTPYELWYGKVPNLSYLKIWGCKALVKRDTPDKLKRRSVKCIFIGYLKKMMGYYFNFLPENKIIVSSGDPVNTLAHQDFTHLLFDVALYTGSSPPKSITN
nr:retrovirus-related Pol polyprotein from transposon TNT 1-94 [Tanacetum cinerariifolium]